MLRAKTVMWLLFTKRQNDSYLVETNYLRECENAFAKLLFINTNDDDESVYLSCQSGIRHLMHGNEASPKRTHLLKF